MDIGKRMYNLVYIIDALQFKVGDIKFLFANLDAELTAEDAERVGLIELYRSYLGYKQAQIDAEKEQTMLHDYCNNKIGWRRIALENGNRQSLGAVYICPHCDSKSPEDFPYCPHCGMIVGRGYKK